MSVGVCVRRVSVVYEEFHVKLRVKLVCECPTFDLVSSMRSCGGHLAPRLPYTLLVLFVALHCAAAYTCNETITVLTDTVSFVSVCGVVCGILWCVVCVVWCCGW